MTLGRVIMVLYALVFLGLCVMSYRWHHERKCVDTRQFEIGDQMFGAKGTWCARWVP